MECHTASSDDWSAFLFQSVLVCCLSSLWQHVKSIARLVAPVAARWRCSLHTQRKRRLFASRSASAPWSCLCKSPDVPELQPVSLELALALHTGLGKAAPSTAATSGYGYEGKLPHLLQSEFPQLQSKVYVDHAGATLYSRSQIEAVKEVCHGACSLV